MAENSAKPWDKKPYRTVVRIEPLGHQLKIEFGDDTTSFAPTSDLALLIGANPRWNEAYTNGFELVVPTDDGESTISWTELRRQTDPKFAKFWEAQVNAEVTNIGSRLRNLRKSKGLSSKALAKLAGITPQSLSRIENGHHDVTYSTLKNILFSMDYSLSDLEEVKPVFSKFSDFARYLETFGLRRELLIQTILPKSTAEELQNDGLKFPKALNDTISLVSHIFGFDQQDLILGRIPNISTQLFPATEFKTPTKALEKQSKIYSVFSYYLATAIKKASKREFAGIPYQSAADFSRRLEKEFGRISLESLMTYIWNLGIPIIPLKESGGFHGACFEIEGCPVIVLKQNTSHHSRWLFDAAHEFAHLVHGDLHRVTRSYIEDEEISILPKENIKETGANNFALDLLLDSRATELGDKCAEIANGDIKYLKSAVISVSNSEKISVDILANYLAHRLKAENNINWWPTSNSLQITEPRPISVATDLLYRNIEVSKLTAFDRKLIARATS